MKATDCPSRPAIQASQLNQLRGLVAEIFPGNKFYTRKLNDAGITFDIASLADFSRRFPFTTKQELVADQRQNPPFGTNLTLPLQSYTRFHQTSGTSGSPLRWLDDSESWNNMVDCWMEVFRAAGVTATDRVFFAFSFGPFIGFWLAFESATRLGCLCVPGGGLSSIARLHAILENQATVLCCTPTYALRLGEVARQEKISLKQSRVRTIVVAGEPGGSLPSVRGQLEKFWPGARVFDHHGMTEVGPVTYECPECPGVLHVLESAFYPEVIEPGRGKAASPGTAGELVLTTLHRTGSPVLRYRTGDLVQVLPSQSDLPCPCGRFEMRLEGGILGRTDDMVVVRGVNLYPSAIDEIARACGEIAEYRVEISQKAGLAEAKVWIEPFPSCADATALARSLEKRFETLLSLRLPVELAATNSLPRFEMKAQRWVKV